MRVDNDIDNYHQLTRTNGPRLALIALFLVSATTTCDSVCTGKKMKRDAPVKSWRLLPRCYQPSFPVGLKHSYGLFSPPIKNACRCSQLANSLTVRGGSDGSGGSVSDVEGEMAELRKKWSAISPAIPSISWSATDKLLGIDSTQSTLDDVGNKHESARSKALIIMDGFSPYHGQYIAHAARHTYGATIINVFSDFITRYLYEVQGQIDHLSCRLPTLESEEDVKAWTALLPSSLKICGIYCESDSGLEDAERLGLALNLYPHCHDGVNNARRNKFLMNKVVSEVGGLDIVKQKCCRTIEEAVAFASMLGLGEDDNDESLVVVKPLRGVASDDVHLCSNLSALREAFQKILNSPIFGSPTASKHEQVLVQEFAAGVEYAVDVVCRNGERKIAALWRYDKRAVNGAPFVYFATELVSVSREGVEQEVCKYACRALEALGVCWGLSHVEVIVGTSITGKIQIRLVEVNCRQHNTDFMPLTNACVGYNALDLVLAAYLSDAESNNDDSRGPQWDSFPALPTTHACGAIIHFVSHVEGKISRIRFDVLEEIEDLPSVMDLHVYQQFLEVGNPIQKTVDIRSDTGWAHIMNDDEDEFRRDKARIVDLMKDMFEVEVDNK